MKAVLLHGYGDVDQLQYEDVPDPNPQPGEVLVRVISTSINPIDYKVRSGIFKEVTPLKLPAILGRDVAGEVRAIGEGVTAFHPGNLVMGVVNQSYAEFLTAKADVLTRIPEGLNSVDAGVLPLILLTGVQLMEQGVRPKSGETILVTGALGSVGRTAVYVALETGATVIAGVRSNQKTAAEDLGVDGIVALDDDTDVDNLPELDAIADTVGGKAGAQLIPKLKKSGRLASVVGKPSGAGKVDVREVWSQPDPRRLHQLAVEVRDGKFEIPIARRMRLSEIREAQQLAEKGAHGKIALIP